MAYSIQVFAGDNEDPMIRYGDLLQEIVIEDWSNTYDELIAQQARMQDDTIGWVMLDGIHRIEKDTVINPDWKNQ